MPITSTQISGLVGGNQVAFANQASYSQQLGSLYGTGPQISPPSMQNPFPSHGGGDYSIGFGQAGGGGAMVGTAAMAMPAAITGAGLAGAMIGGSAGWLDPFTAGWRAFSGGAGAGTSAGAGLIPHIGRTFMQGGIRAGMGAMGGGAMALGATMLPYMAIGAGVQGAAESVYEGAQTYADAGRIGQSFGPAYGQSGSLPGGKLPRHQIRQIATVLEEFADENVIASVQTATRLAQKFSQMGMMSGVYDASSFKQKFQSLTKQVDTIAKVMGTSLEEAAPVLQNMQRMGLWRPEDVMGTLMTAKMVGPQAAQQMMGAMQTGAQQSHALGGSLGAGAALGREAFMTIQGGMRTGTFSNESIMEYTGGVGGVQGQQMVAQQLTTAMQRAGSHPLYQAMMAGLGEMQGGKFTGRIDEGKLQEFMSGGMTAHDLMAQGRKRTRGRTAKLSFDYRRQQLSQEMVAKGGVGGLARGLEGILSEREDWQGMGEEAQGRLLQMITGSDQRTAEMIRRVIQDHRQIQGDHEKRALDAVEDYYRQRERRAHHSWQGFKDSLSHRSQQAWRPLREVGADLSQTYDETVDAMARGIYGIDRGINVTASQAQTMALRGQISYGQPGYMQGADEVGGLSLGVTGLMRYGTMNRGEILRRTMSADQLRAVGGDAGGIASAALTGFRAGGAIPLVGNVYGAAIGAGARYLTGGAGELTDEGLMVLGRGEEGQRLATTRQEAESSLRRAVTRARSSDAYTLGFQGEKDSEHLQVVKNAMKQLSSTAEGRNELRRIKKEGGGTGSQSAKIMELLRGSSPEARQAINKLRESKNSGSAGQDEQDILRAVEGEVALPDSMTVDWSEDIDAIAWSDLDAEAFKKQESDAADKAAAGLRSSSGLTGVGRKFATSIAAGAAAYGPLGAFAGAGIGMMRSVYGAVTGGNVSEEELRSLVTDPDVAPDLAEYLRTGTAPQRLLDKAKGNDTIEKLMSIYDQDPDARKAALDSMKDVLGSITYKAGQRTAEERAESARHTLSSMDKIRMGASDKGEFASILKDIASGRGDVQEGAIERLGNLGARMMKTKAGQRQLRGAGAFGELAMGVAEIQGISEAKGAEGFKKIRNQLKHRFGVDIYSQQQDEIDKMLTEGGGLSKGELEELERRGMDIAKQLSVRGGGGRGKGGAGGPMGDLVSQLTSYTSANTKFVHTVGAFVSGVNTGDLKEIADRMKEIAGQNAKDTSGKVEE